MFRPLTTLRRWLRSRSQADAPPQVPAVPKYRPALTALEDRIAPGDILSGVLAAAIGGALLNPLGQVSAWVGSPSAGLPPLSPTHGSTISIGAGTRPPPELPSFHIPLARPESERAATLSLPSAVVELPWSLDDQFLFAPESQAAEPLRFDATAAVSIPSSRGESVSGGVRVESGVPAFGGGTVGVAGAGNDVSFLLRPATRPQSTSDAGHISVTGTTGGESVGTVRLDGGADVSSNFEYIADLPPNTAPVAKNDTASVSEDKSVIIDVMANDTDADSGTTLRINTWDWKPAHGTVTQEPDGTLKYTPFPDYPAGDDAVEETFTYAVTDGRDVSNTATVTVTINPVNDGPLAFNDAFRFSHTNHQTDPDPMVYTRVAEWSGSLLSNDGDRDGETIFVYAVDTTDTSGTITVDAETGTFVWEGPRDYYGATAFKYRVADAGGALSDWATVKLWVGPYTAVPVGDPDDPFAAVDDLVPVGDEPQSFNVMDNDTDGAMVVLASQPGGAPGGMLTAFDFAGNATYAPSTSSGDAKLSYRLFKADGSKVVVANVQMADVDLDIYHGQEGSALRDENDDETKIGAFTVVNLNDTDGDGTIDNVDKNGVIANHGVGVNEMDLMSLRVHKPTGFGNNAADKITVEIKEGEARLFGTSKRETAYDTKIILTSASFNNPAQGQPQLASLDFWVEVYAPNNNLRTIKIEMNAQLGNRAATDKVAATGVWVALEREPNPNGFHVAGTSPGAQADDENYLATFLAAAVRWDAGTGYVPTPGFKLGMPDMHISNTTVPDCSFRDFVYVSG